MMAACAGTTEGICIALSTWVTWLLGWICTSPLGGGGGGGGGGPGATSDVINVAMGRACGKSKGATTRDSTISAWLPIPAAVDQRRFPTGALESVDCSNILFLLIAFTH